MKNHLSRFFLFSSGKNYYIYDKFSLTLNKIDEVLFFRFNEGNFTVDDCLSDAQKSIVLSLLNQEKNRINYFPEEKCYVSINMSSACNMHCSYCFRLFKGKMKVSTLEDIFYYVTGQYFPDAKEYIFSVDYSSESLLDISLINKLDELIAENEGFLFSEDDFINITPKNVLNGLLEICKDKIQHYLVQDNIIGSLNKIMMNIDLHQYFSVDFLKTISPYYYNFLSISRKLCKSKRVQLNRRILEKLYENQIKIFECKQYYTISFMTNGLAVNKKIVNYLKSRLLKEIYISLDGTEDIHNLNRKDLKLQGTYTRIVDNIRMLQKNGFEICISCVLTPNSKDLVQIFKHFVYLKVKKVDFHYARPLKTKSFFTIESIKNLTNELDKVYDAIKIEIMNNDFSLLEVLKDSKLFFFLKMIIKQQVNTNRCKWGYESVFDINGDIYPCQYMLNIGAEKISNYKEYKSYNELIKPIHSDQLDLCKNCWAEYICGGTCHYASFIEEKNIFATNKIECIYNKALITNSIKFTIFLIENNLYNVIKKYFKE